jgi:nucleotide-binding universal stress UspA family protein
MRLTNIVAAVDTTPAGVHALRTGALLAEAAGARLTALRVVSDPWTCVRPEEIEPLRRHEWIAPSDLATMRAEAELQELIASSIGSGRAEARISFGIPGIELARWAQLHSADLLILGRQPHGEFERRPADRTVYTTLLQGDVPCLVVPFGQRRWRHVVAVVNRELPQPPVIELARVMAALWNEEPGIVRIEAANRHRSRVYAIANSGEPEGTDDPGVVSADAVGETLKRARADQADLLVVGYPKRGIDGTAGSFVRRLLERAPCALLAVPV